MDQVALHDDKAPAARDVNTDDWAIPQAKRGKNGLESIT